MTSLNTWHVRAKSRKKIFCQACVLDVTELPVHAVALQSTLCCFQSSNFCSCPVSGDRALLNVPWRGAGLRLEVDAVGFKFSMSAFTFFKFCQTQVNAFFASGHVYCTKKSKNFHLDWEGHVFSWNTPILEVPLY